MNSRISIFVVFSAIVASAFHADARAVETSQGEYLSDLLSDRLVSVTQGWGELRIDAAVGVAGQPSPKLRIKNKEYARGLGTHANGEIVIDLNKQFKTFVADVGVQWSDGKSPGSVVFQVLVDGKKVFDSGVMRENDPPRPVSISVEGADELRLVVSDAGDEIGSDGADWADARLTRDPAAKDRGESPVDIAPFARVLSWDPKVTQGTKANRVEEMPAEDVAPYKEMLPSANETYVVPTTDGTGSIGLQWDETRFLRRVEIEFPGTNAIPPVESVQLQFWTGEAQTRELQCWSGESAWQGNWRPTKAVPERIGNSLVWRFDYRELGHGAQKVRWVFSGEKTPMSVKRMSAFTRSRWQTVDVRIEPARPSSAKKAEIEIYNGVILNPPQDSSRRCEWDGSKPLLLKVRAAVPQNYKADRTVLRFQMPGAAFGVAIEDLLANDCVYVPHANVFVTRVPSPITPDDYLKKIASRRTMLEEVRQKPDQDFARAWAALQKRWQDDVPMMISLACDNRKFQVERNGTVAFNEYNHPDDPPGASDGVHTVVANIGQWRFVPRFGEGQPLPITRHLDGGWLPIPVTTVQDKSIAYRQTTCIAPASGPVAGKPAWLRERAFCAIEYQVKNTGTEPSDARLILQLASARDPNRSVQYYDVAEGFAVTNNDRLATINNDRVLAFVDTREAGILSCKRGPEGLVLSGALPGGGSARCVVYLPAWKLAPTDYAVLMEGNSPALRVGDYWKSLLEPAMQIEIPDILLSNIIRASQVHCLLAARNEDRCELIAPWISSIFYGVLDSESNSVIRGMDMIGHAEFGRRALDYMLKKRNLSGFVALNYTLVGNGEILWNVGEHYQRTSDRVWMRKVAPDVVRICQWIIRQRAKTKHFDAHGQKVPEYGLSTPGVSADWCRFAYRFFNEAQYYRGLEMAGKALADIGDPAAPAILKDAEEYREDIARAHHSMQARSPVVLLRNGTWAPANPSLFGAYGNVEDFMPAVLDCLTEIYSCEIGSHHLVVNGVLEPTSKDAEWMIDYLEDVLFLRRWRLEDVGKIDAFDLGGFGKLQPYYGRATELHALRDDVKPFIRAYFNAIPALLAAEDLSFWESRQDGGWNKTHETGWFLCQTQIMFVAERGDELWLAPFVTNRWLKDGQKVAVRNAPTRFGRVGYTIASHVAKGEIEAVVQLPRDCTAKKVVLRLRHPEGKPIRSVAVQGRPHADFDPQNETIAIEPVGEMITVRAEY